MKKLLPIALALFMVCPANADNTAPAESPAQRDARMQWWRDAKFGLFIHWGLYCVPAGDWKGQPVGGLGEWIMNGAKIPAAEYEKLAGQFNPVKFDAEQWVLLAKAAGQKYIVITSKHHDGFAMFDSKASAYNIVAATPFKRDVLKELADACRKHDMKLGFYYSQAQDWHHGGGAGNHWDTQLPRVSMDKYIAEKAAPQVRELLTNYGKVAIFWWDTPVNMTRERAAVLSPLLKLQPGIISNDRLGGHAGGDFGTPEQVIPKAGTPGRDWETCMTMNNTWGFKTRDDHWKSTQTLVRMLIDSVSKGGNFLLNVGPRSDGTIPPESVQRLREMGAWLKVNGEAIYGTRPSALPAPQWGRYTVKADKLYAIVFDWPTDGKLPLKGPIGQIKKAYLLAQGDKRLEITQAGGGNSITLPKETPDKIATVVVIELESGHAHRFLNPGTGVANRVARPAPTLTPVRPRKR
ncbi:MAG: alpha-L-fucosidase [Planctomycetaceae bacterium]|nr:alpha-L-fucosidase [Planctomycetaceae bacterium]